jgi:hypothetical protein
MALAFALAASRCSDLVGLGVFEVILTVYRRFWEALFWPG